MKEIKKDIDLEAISLINEVLTKSQSINLNSQSLTIEHKCNYEDTNCTFNKYSPTKDHNGIHIISHCHKDYGKVDLSHLNNYTKILSMSHYDVNNFPQNEHLMSIRELDNVNTQNNNDERLITDKNNQLQSKVNSKLKAVKRKLGDVNQINKGKERRDNKNNQLVNTEGCQLKTQKPRKYNSDKDKPFNDDDEFDYINNNHLQMHNNINDNINNFNPFASSSDTNANILRELKEQANKPITVNDCIELNTPSNYKKLLSKYKDKVINTEDKKSPQSNRNNMRKIINLNSVPTNELNTLRNYFDKDKNTSKSRNEKKNDFFTMNRIGSNKVLLNYTECKIEPRKLYAPRYNWWLYYNSIIYPSNSIEESIVKIDRSVAFK